MSSLSLYRRFQLIFIAIALGLTSLFFVLMDERHAQGSFEGIEMSLVFEATDFIERYRQDQDAPLTSRAHLRQFVGKADLPKDVKVLIELIDLHDWEAVEVEEMVAEGTLRFLMRNPLPNTDAYLYSIAEYDLEAYSNKHSLDPLAELADMFSVLLVGFLALALLSYLAYITSSSLLKPIQTLSTISNRFAQGKPIQHLVDTIPNNEIGEIARQLQLSLENVKASNEREAWFLRHASHELRTPIAVTQSALEIIGLRQSSGRTDINGPLKQISDANRNMLSITQSLLYMSKEEKTQNNQDLVLINELLSAQIEQHRYLLDGASKPLLINEFDVKPMFVNSEMLNIVLANLVRNAFEHSVDGDIEISIEADSITIENSVAESNSSRHLLSKPESFGLGLLMCQKISDLQGWSLRCWTVSPERLCFKLVLG